MSATDDKPTPDQPANAGCGAAACSPLPPPSYSTDEGPICPFCGREYTADGPEFMDEHGTEMECDQCGNEIRIEAHISVAWTTRAIRRANDPGHGRRTEADETPG